MNRAGQRVVTLIREIATKISKQYAPQIFYGKVTAVDSLRIRVDERYEISEKFIILDSRCRETIIKIPQNDTYTHTHEMQDALGSYQGIAPSGPVVWIPAGANMPPMMIQDPEYPSDPTKQIKNPEYETALAALAPAQTLQLTHKHINEPNLESIMLWRGLEVGDEVKILRVASMHYIIERVEGVTNDPQE